MAARSKVTKRKTRPAVRRGAAGGGGAVLLLSVAKVSLILLVGVLAGYFWRSYYPVALPFESRLVADKSSSDIEGGVMTESLVRRARQAETERDRLARQLESLEAEQERTERELAELKIKSVLSQRN